MSLFQVVTTYCHPKAKAIYRLGDYITTDENLTEGEMRKCFRELPEPPSVETVADVVIACKWWLALHADDSIAPGNFMGDGYGCTVVGMRQEKYLVDSLAKLVDQVAKLPDALARPFSARDVRAARSDPELRTLVKELQEWAVDQVEAPQPSAKDQVDPIPMDLPADGTKFVEEQVPPEFREGGKANGAILTTNYLTGRDSDWGFKGPYLSKNCGPGKTLTTRIMVGKKHVYLFKEVSALRRIKTDNED